MKKILTLILASAMVFTIAGCGKGDDTSSQSSNSDTPSSSAVSNHSSEESKVEESTLENWGVEDSLTARNSEDEISEMFICLPELLTINQGSGKVAYQTDESLVIMGGQRSYNETLSKADEIFPAYFDNIVEILDDYRSYKYTDFKFEITEKENLEINGYDMCKYKGTHTFTYNDAPQTMQYVAYSTFMKENGAAVYWMVLDETEDQSLEKVIESHADNMAKTAREDN